MRRKRVVIVGAGIAGLTCARELRDTYDQDVVVLEARDRLGGRLHTADGIDLGGSWLHGSANNVLMSFDTVQTKESPVNGSTVAAFGADGKRWSAEEYDQSETEWHDALEATTKAPPRGGDRSLLSAFQPVTDRCRWGQILAMQSYMAADLGEVSLAHWHECDIETQGVDRYFPGGFCQIVNLLAAGTRVEHGCVVEAVEERADGEGAVVRCVDGRTFEAVVVVCTLPLGVLQKQSVRFDPPLPPPIVAAIDAMGFGTLGKVVLTFDRVFWDRDAVWISVDPDQTTRATFVDILNLYRCNGRPILVGFSGGSFATGFSNRTDSDIAAELMGVLRVAYPDAPDPIAVTVTRWNDDPFAYGSYSFFRLGGNGLADVRTLAAGPVTPRVILAGEHTSTDFPGFAHGAYLSGQRAAKQVALL
jgi:polyamine oxidase